MADSPRSKKVRSKDRSPLAGFDLGGGQLEPVPSKARRSTFEALDTALLVVVGLVVAFIAWQILAGLIGTILFVAKLAVVVLVAVFAFRLYRAVTRRRR